MAGIKKIEMQDHEGNIIHPHTEAAVVFMNDGRTLENVMTESVTAEDITAIIEWEE